MASSDSSAAPFAICFDVDGVLYKAGPSDKTFGRFIKRPCPGAEDALRRVQKAQVPFLFVSNGTGSTEAEKIRDLHKLFPSLEKNPDSVILAQTPMRSLEREACKLVVAGTKEIAHRIAKSYEWTNYVTLQDYAATHPHLFSLKVYEDGDVEAGAAIPPIEAVMLLQAPLDGLEALQVLTDVLRSDGTLGAAHELASKETPQAVRLHVSNPDFDYSGMWEIPRFTLGAFVEALRGVYARATGRDLEATFYGKPFAPLFTEAEARLASMGFVARQADGDSSVSAAGASSGASEVDRSGSTNIYMVGDNPQSDIRGANQAGWCSVLVRTGCFQGEGNDPMNPAVHVVDTVLDAVELIFKKEGLETSA